MRESDLVHVVGEEEYIDRDGNVYVNNFDEYVEAKELADEVVIHALSENRILKSSDDDNKLLDLRFDVYE